MEQGVNVLSLFDGMSCGQLALERAGIKVNKYYASEIDKYAIKVARANYPETIHLGDVRNVKSYYMDDIDIIIGGSPCQGFSFAGKQLNFDDPRSKLFFEMVRLIKECKPKYFLLENVVMKKEYQDVITKELGVEPILINSALVSAQNRKRLYWTNIPNIGQPSDKKIFLRDILHCETEYLIQRGRGNNPGGKRGPKSPSMGASSWDQNVKVPITLMSDSTIERFKKYGLKMLNGSEEKARCLTAMEYLKNGKQGNYLDISNLDPRVGKSYIQYDSNGKKQRSQQDRAYYLNSKMGCLPACRTDDKTKILLNEKMLVRKLTPIECERLQTVPDNYTNHVSNSQRYKMLGNGWTIDVISHLFKGLKDELY